MNETGEEAQVPEAVVKAREEYQTRHGSRMASGEMLGSGRSEKLESAWRIMFESGDIFAYPEDLGLNKEEMREFKDEFREERILLIDRSEREKLALLELMVREEYPTKEQFVEALQGAAGRAGVELTSGDLMALFPWVMKFEK